MTQALGLTSVIREAGSLEWSEENYIKVTQCGAFYKVYYINSQLIQSENSESVAVLSFSCGDGESKQIVFMESYNEKDWKEYTSSEALLYYEDYFPMKADPTSKRLFFSTLIDKGKWKFCHFFEYKLSGQFIKVKTQPKRKYYWEKIVLYEKYDQLFALKLTSNWGYYDSNTDDFIEFTVDSPNNYTYFPLPKLDNYAFSFKFHAYNGYVILLANKCFDQIVMRKIKYQFCNSPNQ